MIIISVKYIQIHQLFFNKFNLITTSGLIRQKELHCFFIKTMLLGIHFKYTHASPFILLSFSCIHTKHNTVSFVDFIFSFGFFSLLFSALSVTDAARLVKGTSFIFLRAVMVSDTLRYMMDKSTSSLSKVLVKEARDVQTSHSKWMK